MNECFSQCSSFVCCEVDMTKSDSPDCGPILKKLKRTRLVSDNLDNCDCEVAESQEDKLSDLPDSLIHLILSFLETKDTVQTCVLSKRWRYLWASVPCLNFSSRSFNRLVDFNKFVLWVLSHRDSSQVKVLIYYRFGVDYATDQNLLNKIIEYAISHGVEEVRINLRGKTSGSPPVEIPLSLFSCQSLRKLELKNCHPTNVSSSPFGCKSLEMLHLEHFSTYPAVADFSNSFASLSELFGFTTLTTLHLNSFTLCYTGIECLDPFGNCVNLKNLQLSEMSLKSDLNLKDFVISAPQLKNLSLMCNRFKCKIVVAAPQLTNFSYLYSTPCAFFEFNLPLDGLIIDIHEPRDQLEKSHRKKREHTLHGLINMIRGHRKSEAVKLSFCTVAVTCGTAVLIKPECFSFSKLKSLNFGVGTTYKIFINNLDHITAYFRNCSQHADFEIVTI